MNKKRMDVLNDTLKRLNKKERYNYEKLVVSEDEVAEKMKNYSTYVIDNTNYVLTELKRPFRYQKANFMETGKALVGILENGESLRDFIEYQIRLNFILQIEWDVLYDNLYKKMRQEDKLKKEVEKILKK